LGTKRKKGLISRRVGVDIKKGEEKIIIELINTTKGFHPSTVFFFSLPFQPLAEKALLDGNLIKTRTKNIFTEDLRRKEVREKKTKRVQKLIM
jgi:hypothetical protein